MELRQLSYFVAVAETGNISRAAQKIFLTQPALSRQIKSLEDEIGQCLLERQAHSVRLTPVGEVLLEEARELLQRADILLDRVRSAGGEVRLRVGYAPSLAEGLLSGAVGSFRQRHPAARVELLDLSTQEMLSGLEEGSLDVVITVKPEREGRGSRWTGLTDLTWRIAVSREHPLAQGSEITPAQAADASLLVFSQREYPEYWDIVTGWLRANRQRPAIGGEYDGVHSLLAAVSSGLGVALVTDNTARLAPEGVVLKQLSASPGALSIAAGQNADQERKPCSVFIEELRQAASSWGG